MRAAVPGRNRWPARGRRAAPGRALSVIAALLALALPGCFSEILPAPPVSTLAFACAVIDPTETPRVHIVSSADDVTLDTAPALAALAAELVRISGRDPEAVTIGSRDAPPQPRNGWNETRLADWARDQPFLARTTVTVHVLWLATFSPEHQLAIVPAPGAVVVAQDAVREAAARLGRPEADVARAALLHAAGHALGVTNRGIPVQDPDLQERESTPGHDADPASALAAGWDDARTATWAANATYDRYPDAALADWQAARGPDGVCP